MTDDIFGQRPEKQDDYFELYRSPISVHEFYRPVRLSFDSFVRVSGRAPDQIRKLIDHDQLTIKNIDQKLYVELNEKSKPYIS